VRSRRMLPTPGGHLPKRTGLGRVMTEYKLSKNTERHTSESGGSTPDMEC